MGYVIARAAVEEAEILNLGVDPAWRRRGIGRALIDAVMTRLGTLGVTEVFLEVRVSNVAAQRLYAGFGFRPVGYRRGYYRAPVEDAVILRTAI